MSTQQRSWKRLDGEWIEVVSEVSSWHGWLAGMEYENENGVARAPLWRMLSHGILLRFELDPNNQYDSNAILVYREGDDENDVGYLNRSCAQVVAPILRSGKKLKGAVGYRTNTDLNEGDIAVQIDLSVDTYRRNADSWLAWQKKQPSKATSYKTNCRGELAVKGQALETWQTVEIGNEVSLWWIGDTAFRRDQAEVFISDQPVGYLKGNNSNRLEAWCELGYEFQGEVFGVSRDGSRVYEINVGITWDYEAYLHNKQTIDQIRSEIQSSGDARREEDIRLDANVMTEEHFAPPRSAPSAISLNKSYSSWLDDGSCDVSASVSKDGWLIHVPGWKRIAPGTKTLDELMEDTPEDEDVFMQLAGLGVQGLSHDGEVFIIGDINNFRSTLLELKECGYSVPQAIFDEVELDIKRAADKS